ncbi:type III pantothenate kinase [Caldinitratiruptor microaerophilus]|uniref:Type III pantothenate kinase n=1 Tax=Caldinitratiruptor microaerophilus TaxID=671077 RepID=A0AA35CP11_9FIRM|nr:type III pantothenate kinase [Caldinitratiruptor microaerophilus]BDG62068.1 type III pantothenate kinase [Caldinitratiruptor microaerophilus]
MLLALDVGNTNVTVGLYAAAPAGAGGGAPLRSWRLETRRARTADEYGLWLVRAFRLAGLDPGAVTAAAMASVVPPLTPVLVEMCRRYFGAEPLIVSSRLRSLPAVRYEDPSALGADRLANAVAAWVLHGGGDPTGGGAPGERATVAVDFGTATKLEVVAADGTYLGGSIAPGVGISTEALFESAARLARVELVAPPRVLGRNNAAAMQSGILYGFAGQVEGLLRRVREELGEELRVVGTGGLAHVVAPHCRCLDTVDPWLTLAGIRLIWEWNRPPGT